MLRPELLRPLTACFEGTLSAQELVVLGHLLLAKAGMVVTQTRYYRWEEEDIASLTDRLTDPAPFFPISPEIMLAVDRIPQAQLRMAQLTLQNVISEMEMIHRHATARTGEAAAGVVLEEDIDPALAPPPGATRLAGQFRQTGNRRQVIDEIARRQRPPEPRPEEPFTTQGDAP